MILNEELSKEISDYNSKLGYAAKDLNDNCKKIKKVLFKFHNIHDTIQAGLKLYEKSDFLMDAVKSRYNPFKYIYYDKNSCEFYIGEDIYNAKMYLDIVNEKIYLPKTSYFDEIDFDKSIDTYIDNMSDKNIIKLAEYTTKFVEIMDNYLEQTYKYFENHKI